MHLTYPDSDTHTGTASTANAGEAGAPEIEITASMLAAGISRLRELQEAGVSTDYLVREVWSAIRQAALAE